MTQDIGLERTVLAGLLQYGSQAFCEVGDLITENTFSTEGNQTIFKCIKHILNNQELKKLDIPSIIIASKDIGLDDFFSGTSGTQEKRFLKSLCDFPISEETLKSNAIRLKKLEVVRDLHQKTRITLENLEKVSGNEDITEIISIPYKEIDDYIDEMTEVGHDIKHISEGLDEFVENSINCPVKMVGLSTGIKEYDVAIGSGLRKNSVNVIGARLKVGKSSLGINAGLHNAKNGIPVGYFDMELDVEDFWAKMLAHLSGIGITDIETGNLNNEEKSQLRKAKTELAKLPFYYINIASKSFEESLIIMKRFLMKTVGKNADGSIKDCLLIYDYFRLNDSEILSQNIQEYQALGFQIIMMKNFAKKFQIPILTFVQLNRDGITKEDTDAVSGSDRIMWIASNFTIFKKKTEEEIAENRQNYPQMIYNRKLVPIVARHGPEYDLGEYINLHLDGAHCKVIEGPLRSKMTSFVTGNDASNDVQF